MPAFTLQALATELGVDCRGREGLSLQNGAPLDSAAGTELSFLSNPRYADQVAGSNAGAIVIRQQDLDQLDPALVDCGNWLVCEDPYSVFAMALSLFHPARTEWGQGIHAAAFVDPQAQVDPTAVIGPAVVIEAGAVIGAGTVILANSMIYRGAQIGRDCLLHAGCHVRENCRLGDRVLLHNGTVIGSDGFGFAPGPDGKIRKIPQTGIVDVGDDVEMGANCTIDRATMGVTQIGSNCKLDNMVHVAHNVSLGPGCMIAGQTGIAGSTPIGPGCIMGGNAAISGHLVLGKGVMVGGHSGVTANAADGSKLAGFPASKHKDFLAQSAALRKLPALRQTIKELQRQVQQLEAKREGEEQ